MRVCRIGEAVGEKGVIADKVQERVDDAEVADGVRYLAELDRLGGVSDVPYLDAICPGEKKCIREQ